MLTNILQGELAHRLVKRLYGLTNKRKPEAQMAKRYQRVQNAEAAWKRYCRQQKPRAGIRCHHKPNAAPSQLDLEVEGSDLELRYHVSASTNVKIDLRATLKTKSADPAYSVSVDSVLGL